MGLHKGTPGNDNPAPATDHATGFYVALGIPQGVIADPSARVLLVRVRRGGELVSLSPDDYAVWGALLTPRSTATLAEIASLRDRTTRRTCSAISRTWRLLQIRPRESKGELARLPTIPRGVVHRELAADAGRLPVRNYVLVTPPCFRGRGATVMLWWEFDGPLGGDGGLEGNGAAPRRRAGDMIRDAGGATPPSV